MEKSELIDTIEIATRLQAELPGWVFGEQSALEKTFDRGGFDGSIAFVNEIAKAANAANHHPDLRVSWNEVTVILSSHDAGGVTDRDFKLAKTIETLAG